MKIKIPNLSIRFSLAVIVAAMFFSGCAEIPYPMEPGRALLLSGGVIYVEAIDGFTLPPFYDQIHKQPVYLTPGDHSITFFPQSAFNKFGSGHYGSIIRTKIHVEADRKYISTFYFDHGYSGPGHLYIGEIT